jgi:hypothetical protein
MPTLQSFFFFLAAAMAFPVFAVVGIPVIFVLGFAGALLPSLVSFFFPSYGITRRIYFSFFNGLAAGLILAVGTDRAPLRLILACVPNLPYELRARCGQALYIQFPTRSSRSTR